MIEAGYIDGLQAALWAIGALLGIATLAAPAAIATWLLTNTTRTLTRTPTAWRIRTWPTTHRHHHHHHRRTPQ